MTSHLSSQVGYPTQKTLKVWYYKYQQRLDLPMGYRVAAWYIENESGTSLQRPELMRLLKEVDKGDVILIEQVDRLSRLSEEDWGTLKAIINEKQLAVVSLDLPTSHMALSGKGGSDFTGAMLRAINGMMLDMLIAERITRYIAGDRMKEKRSVTFVTAAFPRHKLFKRQAVKKMINL